MSHFHNEGPWNTQEACWEAHDAPPTTDTEPAERLARRLLEGQINQGGPVPLDTIEDARLYAAWLLDEQLHPGEVRTRGWPRFWQRLEEGLSDPAAEPAEQWARRWDDFVKAVANSGLSSGDRDRIIDTAHEAAKACAALAAERASGGLDVERLAEALKAEWRHGWGHKDMLAGYRPNAERILVRLATPQPGEDHAPGCDGNCATRAGSEQCFA